MNLVELTQTLQNCAHLGYSLHDIKVSYFCGDCGETLELVYPDVEIIVDDKAQTIELKFTKGEKALKL